MNTTLEKQLIDLHDQISAEEDKLKALKAERARVARVVEHRQEGQHGARRLRELWL